MDQATVEGAQVQTEFRPGTRRAVRLGKAVPPPVLVVGCSEQLPNELHAYHLLEVLEDGGVVLSRHDGAAYTGTMCDLSSYKSALTNMVKIVADNLPSDQRWRARTALVKRWNRDWGVGTLANSCAACEADLG